MPISNKSPRGRKSIRSQGSIYNAMHHVSATFKVSASIALEALTAVGNDPEKLADYLKNKRRSE